MPEALKATLAEDDPERPSHPRIITATGQNDKGHDDVKDIIKALDNGGATTPERPTVGYSDILSCFKTDFSTLLHGELSIGSDPARFNKLVTLSNALKFAFKIRPLDDPTKNTAAIYYRGAESEKEGAQKAAAFLGTENLRSLHNPFQEINEMIKKLRGTPTNETTLSTLSSIIHKLNRFTVAQKQWLDDQPESVRISIKEKLFAFLLFVNILKTVTEKETTHKTDNQANEDESDEYPPNHWGKHLMQASAEPTLLARIRKRQLLWEKIDNVFTHNAAENSRPHRDAAETRVQENQEEKWKFRFELLRRDYAKLCVVIGQTALAEINFNLRILENPVFDRNTQGAALEIIPRLIKAQVATFRQSHGNRAESGDIQEILNNSNSCLEQIASLREILQRNEKRTASSNTQEPVQAESPIKNIVTDTQPTASSWLKKVPFFGNWLEDRWQARQRKSKVEPTKSETKLKHPKSNRPLWLMVGFAALSGFFSGRQAPRETDHNPITLSTPTPKTTVAESPTPEAVAQELNTSEKISKEISESDNADIEQRAQSSIQARLQKTLKSSATLLALNSIYGNHFQNISAPQKTYLANTFAGIIRPQLRGFHSNRDTAPLHITYLGRAPHQKHIFMVNSAGHSQRVEVHVPTWNDLSRGLQRADTSRQPHESPVNSGYSNLDETETTQTTPPPPPPGINKSSIANAVDINAALDALSQADHAPRQNTPNPPTRPSEVDLALDELAQSDRNKNQSA